MKPLLAQYRFEMRASLRQGEQMLVSMGIPLLILVFFSLVDVLTFPTEDAVDTLAPGVLALAIVSTSMVSLGIGTGFERTYGVLKRLGASPLGRTRWITAKILTVLSTQILQWLLIVVAAFALGWSPDAAGWLPAIAAGLLGTMAFGGIGLLMAGTLPGVVTLAGANALYLVLLLTGGMVIPLEDMPTFMQRIAQVLPAAPLAEIMITSFSSAPNVSTPTWAWISLAVWAVVAPVVASRAFRWE